MALIKDTDSQSGRAADCPSGYVMANIKLPERQPAVTINVFNGTDQIGLADVGERSSRTAASTSARPATTRRGKPYDEVASMRYGPKAVGAA